MNKKFLLIICLLTVGLFLFQYRLPRRFTWEPSYAASSHQPFGCQLFDSVLKQSMPLGYEVVSKTPWALLHDSLGCRSLLFVGSHFSNDKELVVMARQGWRVLWLMDGPNDQIEEKLHLKYKRYIDFSVAGIVKGQKQYATVSWLEAGADGSNQVSARYEVLQDLIGGTLSVEDFDSLPKGFRVLASCQFPDAGGAYPIAVSYPVGKGELIMVTAPLLFTNYGVLNDGSRPVVAHLLDRVKDMPMVRYDYRARTHVEGDSALSVFLERPPLRLAVYLTLLTLLLFLFFTARRRQRVIPVVEPPRNNNMEFVRLIGMLFYHRHDHQGLLQKKLAFTAEEVRRLTGIDLEHEDGAAERLARRIGMDPQELRQILKDTRLCCQPDYPLSETRLRQEIDHLNEIIQKL